MKTIIQKELPEHYLAVHKILIICFKSDAESKLVTASPPSIAKGLGLAPLAVKPEYQKQGVGAQLVKAGLSICVELEYDYVVLLGSPKYYHRFGFRKASNFGIQNEYGVDDPFMINKLTDCSLQNGLIKYCPEFSMFSI